MATKIIKAWIDGAIREIEVEDIVSPEQPLGLDERVEKLEDKHEVTFTDGNFLIGNGTEELEEITPEEVLSHISGVSVMTLTTEEYEAIGNDDVDTNTLYLLTDSDSNYISGVVRYDETQSLTNKQKEIARDNIDALAFNDIYKTYMNEISYTWDGSTDGRDSFVLDSYTYYKVLDDVLNFYSYIKHGVVAIMSDGTREIDTFMVTGENCGLACDAIVVMDAGQCIIPEHNNEESKSFIAPSAGLYFPRTGDLYMSTLSVIMSEDHDICLKSNNYLYTVGVEDNGELSTRNNTSGNVIRMATKNELYSKITSPENVEVGQILSVKSVDDYGNIIWEAVDNTGNIETDGSLSKEGHAADAKITGDRLSTVESQIADLLYKPIAISSFTNNVSTVEIGSTVASATLSWNTNKTPATLMLDGYSIDTSLTSIAYDNLSITSNKTWTLKATDERNAKSEKTTKITFVNGVYYGAVNSNAAINNDTIIGLTKELKGSKSITFTTTANEGQYIIFALPKSYGTPAFNVGGFDGGFSLKTTFNFENSSGHTEPYCVWLSDNANLGTTTVKVS